MKEKVNDLKLIIAVDRCGGFSKDGKIPWNFKDDLKYFKEKTKELLSDRESIVVSKTLLTDENKSVTIASTFHEAVQKSTKDNIFIIGGYRLYIQSLPFVSEIYLTLINNNYNCNKFFPISYLKKFRIESGEKLDYGYRIKYIK